MEKEHNKNKEAMIPALFENNVTDKRYNIVRVLGEVVKIAVPYQRNGMEHGAMANHR